MPFEKELIKIEILNPDQTVITATVVEALLEHNPQKVSFTPGKPFAGGIYEFILTAIYEPTNYKYPRIATYKVPFEVT